MAACMSRSLADIKEITKLMTECKSMGIQCLPPDVNVSRRKFGVDPDGNIRFGLAAIKGVGESAVEAILSERNANGPFKSIFDFVRRVSISAVKRNGLECLALSGAFDCFSDHISREQFLALNPKGDSFVDVLTRFSSSYQVALEETRNSLFGDMDMVDVPNPVIPEAESWNTLTRLDKERELVGIYLSAHPLDDYKVLLDYVCNVKMAEIEQAKTVAGNKKFGGIVVDYRTGRTKYGKDYGVAKVEDYSGIGELALFGEDFAKYGGMMSPGSSIFITATVAPSKFDEKRLMMTVKDVRHLSDVKNLFLTKAVVELSPEAIDEDFVARINDLTNGIEGITQLQFRFLSLDGRVISAHSSRPVNLTPALVELFEEYGTLLIDNE